MLFQFRVPRTRPWDEYAKKFCKFLEKDEATAHLSAYFEKCQVPRTTLTKLLEECAKANVIRADEIIKVCNEYIPLLEQFYEGLVANNVKLIGYLQIVWTSYLTYNVNAKSLSHNINWERNMAYQVLALAHYAKAVDLHHRNRAAAGKQLEMKQKEVESWDPIFDTPPKSDGTPMIMDDVDMIKEISINLKTAASIWFWVSSNLFPVDIEDKQFMVIPESFRDCVMMMSNISACNAQEFMVQLCVQTKKSKELTSKLAMGVAKKLKETNAMVKGSIGDGHYRSIRDDLTLYMSVRSRLYSAISHKYMGQVMSEQTKSGHAVAYLLAAKNILTKTPFPNNEKNFTPMMYVMKKSLAKQLEMVTNLHKEAHHENSSVYFATVPNTVDTPEPKWAMKIDTYEGMKEE